jgi:hypothetical protein
LSKLSTTIALIDAGIETIINLFIAVSGSEAKGNLYLQNNTKATKQSAIEYAFIGRKTNRVIPFFILP